MTCDEAFDILTSPAAPSSADLHDHLQLCSRCRDLQEALAPALQTLSHDSCCPDQTPWMQGEQTARDAALRLSHSPAASRLTVIRNRWRWTYLAAFLFGAASVAGIISWWNTPNATASSVPSPSPVCLWQTRDVSVFDEHPDSHAVIMTCVACHLNHQTATAASLP